MYSHGCMAAPMTPGVPHHTTWHSKATLGAGCSVKRKSRAPLAQPTKGKKREGVVRGRWTPRPMEGKAKGKEKEVEIRPPPPLFNGSEGMEGNVACGPITVGAGV